ncbi:MAG: endonuclease III [Tenericutes bacterium GWC2_34_14]|nr:MAG: endonuclease III [Tenericutes bacterium GWC2_34_14]OHE34044.1 MAG: endonuclease III [Tenericutes bacterium GWE2_34_108]OHE35374.1 MAG: endonuclease III [Tenericutes bacterium GWF1_35_14]OHE38480.1 MAG: endonuclease III [Tenericutes bacterium GWF2_35_184]OHE43121.1 MAG: endonuclease III [Tenericutes bacterium RIFOXYA2_FULL_36_32]OHE45539.1 MAG: endonuclease III [Tenericutes bacterium RIFOXYA12_FULL_35_10]OHE47658.1 MAG: endonuclease III [Tenericutes bacterium RIFOXYC2_FULL_35_27]OHE50
MKRAEVISKTLNDMFPHAKVELNFANTFELLVAVVLSAQTTDISVNKVTPSLFFQYPTPKDLKDAPLEKIEQLIRSIGLYRNKAKNIKELARIIDEVYEGTVPSDRERLESLPGVGRKTTNVVLSNAFNIPAFAVDTHVARVSVRLGLAKKGDSVLEIEKKLMKAFPKTEWLRLHHQMIFFGRYHCLAKNPKCYECPLYDLCVSEDKMIL